MASGWLVAGSSLARRWLVVVGGRAWLFVVARGCPTAHSDGVGVHARFRAGGAAACLDTDDGGRRYWRWWTS